jgi:twitching motility protein PilT
MTKLKELLEYQVRNFCSDLHFVTGEPPLLRGRNGELKPIEGREIMEKTEVEKIILEVIGETGLKKFIKEKDVDFGMQIPGVSRFRVTFYEETRGPAIAFRAIPFEIPRPEEIGIPKEILERVMKREGLVLVTGPNGSGKSTTLASLVEYINQRRKGHIITIEDPIEFVFERKKCLISQRAVGVNAESFSDAIKHTVRQDVDVIVVGEMRDLETISTAVTLAETGHLVLATLHTDDAPRAIQRIIDVFPAEQQNQIALQLSHNLDTIMSQRLLPTKDGTGRVCVREVLFANSGIRHAIRTRKISEIYSQIQINADQGMRLFDDHLFEYVRDGVVDMREALNAAHDPQHLLASLEAVGIYQ